IAVTVNGLGDIPTLLRVCWTTELLDSTRNELPVVFLAPEKVELDSVLVEAGSWSGTGPADLIAQIVVAVFRDRSSALIGKPVVGVQAFVAMEPTGIAVEFVGSVFGDNRKLPAAGLAVLRLVVRGQHPQFGNRVGVQRDVRAA